MKRSDYMLAALASAVLPNLGVAGVRENVQASATDEAKGIDQTVIQDASGKLYDVYATDTREGRTRLIRRVKAAQTLAAARELGGLGFDMDRVVAFVPGDVSQPGQTATAQAVGQQAQAESTPLTPRKPGPTGETTVMIAVHRDGQARPLDLLTLDDCAAVGTSIGAIHRLPSTFLANAKYPVVTTGQIRSQLTAWIRRLRSAGHVPQEITDSWARIMDTEGLWSFSTCTVHGGFSDGDFLFSGSTITTVTNWQDMQVNDPARDLAWIFSKLDENHRNALLSAYGRMLGNRLDDLIMLRANLWLQMEQVGDFISALNQADSVKIMQFKAQVERLAHQLGMLTAKNHRPSETRQDEQKAGNRPPSTITVGTLLDESERRRQAAAQQSNDADATGERHIDATDMDDDRTGDFDVTGSQPVRKTKQVVDDATEAFDVTAAEHIASAGMVSGNADSDDTSEREESPVSTFVPEQSARERHESLPSSSTIVISTLQTADGSDDTNEEEIPQAHSEAATMLIPLLERDEATMQKAKAEVDRLQAEDATDEKPRVE